MVGKGKKYRDTRRKMVVTPSGDQFVIRKPGARAYTKQFKNYNQSVTPPGDIEDMLTDEGLKANVREALSEQSPAELVGLMDALIIDCVVDPKIVECETEKDDELWIEDIEMGDYFFLLGEITEFAGVTPEKLRELFRNLGGASGPTGGNDSHSNRSTT